MASQVGLLPSDWPPAPPVPRVKGKKTDWPLVLAQQLSVFKNLRIEREYLFAKRQLGRRWAFDLAFPEFQVAVEVEGLIVLPRCRRCHPREFVVMGRHASATGIKGDMDKYNHAALLGWYVLRFDQGQINPGHAREMTLRVLASHGWRAP